MTTLSKESSAFRIASNIETSTLSGSSSLARACSLLRDFPATTSKTLAPSSKLSRVAVYCAFVRRGAPRSPSLTGMIPLFNPLRVSLILICFRPKVLAVSSSILLPMM